MSGLRFIKVEGLGNDFVMLDCADVAQSDAVGSRAAALCDRRRGVGADGVICVLPAAAGGADFRMRIFNADGGEAEMCGNGVRCFGEYLRLTGRTAERFVIETLAGPIEVENEGVSTALNDRGGPHGGSYRVNMGAPRLLPDDIPVVPAEVTDKDFIMREIVALDKTFKVTAVSMGNPHAVIYAEDLSDELVLEAGPAIQRHPFFPKGVNVEFVHIISRDEVRMRVYERGCGETQACGTGACAAVVAGVVSGLGGNDVTVRLLGGDLRISWDGDRGHPVFMSGPARAVFHGELMG
jgi:diaminopimelate epimerase